VLRRLRLRPRTSAVLEAESGLNDAPAVVVVTLVTSGAWAHDPAWQVAALIVYELVGGAVIGYLVGMAGRWLLPRVALPAVGLYPLAAMALVTLAFGVATLAHESGFLAVYLCALLLGSSRLPHRRSVLGFVEGLAWLAQIGLFVLLGLLAVPSRLPAAVVPAVVAGLALTLVARPLSVLLCATPFGVRWREVGELTVETAPLDEVDALLLDVPVPPMSRLAGEYVADLRLPHGATVTMVVRDGVTVVPDVATRLRTGDRLVVVCAAPVRRATERRLRAVSRRGALAGWFGETGDEA
jgi:cell volume regulation protein A